MLDLFLGLRRLIKRRLVHIDNSVFRLHWQLTSIILISCSVVVTTRQYIGNPINCLTKDKLSEDLLNTFCWINSTYTVPSAFLKSVGREVPHPGIENSVKSTEELKWYPYYQWICFTLFIQGVAFYAPYYLWKLWENGLMRSISLGMQIAIISDEEKGHKRHILLNYLTSHFGCHQIYTFKYIVCEALCLMNVAVQTCFMNWLFDGEFLMFGVNAIRYLNRSPYQRIINPLLFVFPRVTKCTFYDFGSSGDVQKHDAICLLPINVINEKIYIFLWFWFLFLSVSMFLVLLYRLFTVFIPHYRAYFLHARCRLSDPDDLKIICQYGNLGDWFVLYMLGSNLDPLVMAELTGDIANRVREVAGKKIGDSVDV